jgi:tRNA 5-methylaminomethyl-2-thiouridine biosynthesis bifunctional protein
MRFAGRALFTILELGFGTALNFLLTWQAFRRESAAGRLHFISVEKHPFTAHDLARLHLAWPELSELSRALIGHYPPLQSGFHRLHFDGGRIALTLLFGDARAVLPELRARADAFYLDGFAPSRNPEMWQPSLIGCLPALSAAGATVATYSVAGVVKQALSQAGFVVEKRPGFGRKREMLIGHFRGGVPVAQRERRATVIGAGIAGSSCALALARAGFDVELLDSAKAPAAGASANPAGLVRPFLNLEAGARSRFSWAAFAYACRLYRALSVLDSSLWHQGGVLQLARDAAHLAKLGRALSQFAIPAQLAQRVDAEEGSGLCGARVAEAGIWYPAGAWLSGAAASRAALLAGGRRIGLRASCKAHRIERAGDSWVVRDAEDRFLTSSPCVVLANGFGAARLLPGNPLALRPVRGQLSLAPASVARRAPVCQEGYVTPAIDGRHVIGSSYEEDSADTIPRAEDGAANLRRAQRMLPDAFEKVALAELSSWVGVRCVSRDRRPLVGEVLPGLYACLALGSRGFTWAPLAGELLACLMAEEALPIEGSVAAALSPERLKEMERTERGVLREAD